MQRMEIDAPVGKDVWKDILEQLRRNKKEGDDHYWCILHSLARKKPPVAMLPTSGRKKLKPAVGKVFEVEKPPEVPFTCHCKTCWGQYFPASIYVTDREARQLASSLVVDARQDLEFLRQILADHADFLVSRWKKKSREKRSIFLSENVDVLDKKFAAIHLLHMRSSPENCDLNAELMRSLQGIHDPEQKEWFSRALHGSRVAKMTSSYQNTWLLPYLDSDMLSEDPSLLLALLHHRTTHEPEDWILFDDMNADLAERFGIVTQTLFYKDPTLANWSNGTPTRLIVTRSLASPKLTTSSRLSRGGWPFCASVSPVFLTRPTSRRFCKYIPNGSTW
jgi:hypothetical protein